MEKPVMVRLDPSVYEEVAELATMDDRTVAYMVRRAIDKGLPLLREEVARRAEATNDE